MTQPTPSFTEANGLRLHTLTWRPESGDGPLRPSGPVVLNHATGFMARIWQPVAERLVAAGYTAIAYDARGHGDSDKPEVTWENYDWQRFADDLRGFLDALGLRDVPFVGHSMGAGVGLFVEGHHPEYFSRIVAIEPIVIPGGLVPDEERRDSMAASARRRRAVFTSADEMVAQYRTKPTFERCSEELLRLYAEHGTFTRDDGQIELKCSGDVEGEVFASSATLNIWDALPNVHARTLVIRGEHTEGFLSMVAEQVSQRLPDARLLTIPDAAHLVPLERPDVIADEVLAFFDESPPA